MKTVYLAGPIAGLTYAQAEGGWRTTARDVLGAYGIKTLSPLRQKTFLEGSIGVAEYVHPLATDAGIMTRDFNDCSLADVVLCNLSEAVTVSIGTCMEIAWCFDRRVPVVIIAPHARERDLHNHPMIRAATNYRVTSIADGIEIVKSILGVES